MHILPKKWNRVDKSKGQSKTVEPFQQAVSLQDIEHSSKHAMFLSENVHLPYKKRIQPWFHHPVFPSKHRIPTQYEVCDQHSVLL